MSQKKLNYRTCVDPDTFLRGGVGGSECTFVCVGWEGLFSLTLLCRFDKYEFLHGS